MTPQDMILRAYKQQKLTGKKDASVTFFIPGTWPEGQHKRLAGKKGPLGRCIAEFEDSVLCEFQADKVIEFCSKALPVIEISEGFVEKMAEELNNDD